MAVICVDRDDRDTRPLPEVLVLDLGHGHVVAVAHAGFEAPQRLALVLERPRAREMQVEGQQADHHEPQAYYGRQKAAVRTTCPPL